MSSFICRSATKGNHSWSRGGRRVKDKDYPWNNRAWTVSANVANRKQMLCLAGGRTGLKLVMEYLGLMSETPDLTLELFVLKQPHLCTGKMDGLLSSLALQLYLRVVVEGWSSVCCCLGSKLEPLSGSLSWQETSNRDEYIVFWVIKSCPPCLRLPLSEKGLNITWSLITVQKYISSGSWSTYILKENHKYANCFSVSYKFFYFANWHPCVALCLFHNWHCSAFFFVVIYFWFNFFRQNESNIWNMPFQTLYTAFNMV